MVPDQMKTSAIVFEFGVQFAVSKRFSVVCGGGGGGGGVVPWLVGCSFSICRLRCCILKQIFYTRSQPTE
jgi:hypothetical protein